MDTAREAQAVSDPFLFGPSVVVSRKQGLVLIRSSIIAAGFNPAAGQQFSLWRKLVSK